MLNRRKFIQSAISVGVAVALPALPERDPMYVLENWVAPDYTDLFTYGTQVVDVDTEDGITNIALHSIMRGEISTYTGFQFKEIHDA